MFALYLNHGIVLLIRHYVIRHNVRIYKERLDQSPQEDYPQKG